MAADDPHFGPREAERLRGELPGVVDLQIRPDAGHPPMDTRPDEVADRIAL